MNSNLKKGKKKKKKKSDIKRPNPWTIAKTFERKLMVEELLDKLKTEYNKSISFSQLIFDLIEIAYHDPSILIKSQSTTDLSDLANQILSLQKEEQNAILIAIKNLEEKIERLEKLILKDEENDFLLEED